MHSISKSSVIGRFAPSSTGPLHFGSLVCALTSYLMAKRLNGKWFVRIEDVDLERCDLAHANSILNTLEQHGLQWDCEVIYQSKRQDVYEHYIKELNNCGVLYGCRCSRKQIKARSEFYDRYCRDKLFPLEGNVVRFVNDGEVCTFTDKLISEMSFDSRIQLEDPVLRRADGTYAYHLAVIADDIEQGVTQVVRGMDLLEVTPLHMQIYKCLRRPNPTYGHIPLAVHAPNKKYAKQSYSPALDNKNAASNLLACLRFIGIPENHLPDSNVVDEIVAWAVKAWQPNFIPKNSEIIVSESNGLYSLVNS